jgi:hypothetical protein
LLSAVYGDCCLEDGFFGFETGVTSFELDLTGSYCLRNYVGGIVF